MLYHFLLGLVREQFTSAGPENGPLSAARLPPFALFPLLKEREIFRAAERGGGVRRWHCVPIVPVPYSRLGVRGDGSILPPLAGIAEIYGKPLSNFAQLLAEGGRGRLVHARFELLNGGRQFCCLDGLRAGTLGRRHVKPSVASTSYTQKISNMVFKSQE